MPEGGPQAYSMWDIWLLEKFWVKIPTTWPPKLVLFQINSLLKISWVPPLEAWSSPSSQKIYYNNDETHGMTSVIWQGTKKKLCGNFWWEYASIIDAYSHQKLPHNFFLWGKQTGLYEQISAVNKIDNKAFQMHWTTRKPKALQSLTHNLSSLIECTLFLPTLTFASGLDFRKKTLGPAGS